MISVTVLAANMITQDLNNMTHALAKPSQAIVLAKK